ncbi:MAG TPA: hypothetical protein VFW87_23395 [Pirellulales bacterium]|nr:hypothetical protein [Pirellulales bacterium]
MLMETFAFTSPSVLGPRERLALLRRGWWRERQREIPCWLGSLLLHALTVVVLGSLTVPTTTDYTAGSLQLYASYTGDVKLGGATAPIALAHAEPQPAVSPPLADDDTSPAEDGDALAAREQTAKEAAPSAVEPVASDPPSPDSVASDEPEKMAAAATALAGDTMAPARVGPPSETAPAQDPLGGRTPAAASKADPATSERSGPGGPVETAALPDDTPRPAAANQQPYVEVVDRFIEADLGRLTRPQADLAKHDFDRLTPAAIPSLVYGLNKSAKIHASCPVAVLTFKLDMALRKNRDPELLQYALDNLGEGVPDTAPHAERLRTLLDQWRRSDATGSLAPDGAKASLKPGRRRTR